MPSGSRNSFASISPGDTGCSFLLMSFSVSGVHDSTSSASAPASEQCELIVHADAPLARAIALQPLEPVRGRRTQVLDSTRQVELLEFAQRRALEFANRATRRSLNKASVSAHLNVLIATGQIVTHCVINA